MLFFYSFDKIKKSFINKITKEFIKKQGGKEKHEDKGRKRYHSHCVNYYNYQSVINGIENTSGWELSKQDNLFSRTGTTDEIQADGTTITKTVTNGYVNATTSIQPYQTYIFKNSEFFETGFRAPKGLNETDETKNTNYYLFITNGYNTNYWVSSRCIDSEGQTAGYYIACIDSGRWMGKRMFNSYGNPSDKEYSLRPIVTLSVSQISGDSETGFTVSN